METIHGEPDAKRRRIDRATVVVKGGLTTPAYLPLAAVDLAIHIVSTPSEFDANDILKHSIHLRFSAGANLPDEHVVFTGRRTSDDGPRLTCVSPVPSQDAALIRDCAKVEAYQLPSKSRRLGPLVCSSIAIEPRQGSIASSTSDVHSGLQSTAWRLRISLLWQDSIYARDTIRPEVFGILGRHAAASGVTENTTTDRGQGHDHPSVPEAEKWEPRHFYDNVHVPVKTPENSADIRVDLLQGKLFPFQRRAVRWLLSREGVSVEPSGQVVAVPETKQLPPGFTTFQDVDGNICYVNHALGVVSSNLSQLKAQYQSIRGGLLAEEMGLGKTFELLALICLNTKARHPTTSDDPTLANVLTDSGLQSSGATLIITPPTILEQWKQEIREHAPSLTVYHYEGMKALAKGHDENSLQRLASFDIVLTTYNVIAKEVHYVEERPDRNLRYKPRYEPPKSPLIQISWWRVCLDEAQMVESGVSAAATVARLIPRENAWAVTGTPLRSGHKDLYGLLLFLRYEPWCKSPKLWNRLVMYHRPLFRTLMGEIAIRHSKDYVREDLRLPPQSRQTITVPFTPIEEQYYRQLFQEMYEDCGLDKIGAPISDDWDPEASAVVEKMRTWLTRLRQTCLHPEVGGRNRKALGRSGGPLRSVQQVLDVMIDQNDTIIRLEQRLLLLSQILRGQMRENAKETQQALEIWKLAYDESCVIVSECRAQLNAELELQKNDEQTCATEDEPEHDSETEIKLTTLRQRLRAALEVQHICIFFTANAYFQLKSDETRIKPESDEFIELQKQEESAYEEAKELRSELLSEVLRKANRLITSIRSKAVDDEFVVLPKMDLPLDYTGIESRKIFEKLEDFSDAMNLQAGQFNQMRQKMIELLQKSLIDEDEGVELQGDEYESSTKLQDEMYAYMEALRALFADRSDALSGQENTLIRHEMKLLLKAAKEGQGPAPEVLIKLLAEREKTRVPTELGSFRGIVTEIRALITSLQWQEHSARAKAELSIANDILQHAQKLLSSQTKSIILLEQEVNQFRDTMNSRLDYYRALQKISDTVAPFEEEKVGQPLDERAYRKMLAEEVQKNDKISTLLAKKRYLMHLKTESAASTPRICTICQCDFEIGTLTVCGHQFCKECIQLWYTEHHNCPVCKKRLKVTDFWDITYKPAEMAIQGENNVPSGPSPNSPSDSSERSLNKSIYSDISTTTLNEIKDIDLRGTSFGSKVDTIIRHLFWLRDHDPGSKAIIFSQYREFLGVLGRAFKQYKVSFTRFDNKSGIERFKTDPATECFLLHAKAHSAGLNLVVANHVFLCEPLINTAIELQAIARVHRIGQQRATTVWMYLIADTVEESIYEISVTRRLEHLKGKSRVGAKSRSGTATPNVENAIDAANSMQLQSADLSRLLASGKSGGEVVETQDLWQCLFGRAKKGKEMLDSNAPAAGEVGRFLRAEAAETRKEVQLPSR